mmetsp:Transcript_15139/g.42410  ORF Transcript_15139/g.42410 Transcript_15139/m.42410 type:complete len:821 (+) Transcript_15139:412-2874(+)
MKRSPALRHRMRLQPAVSMGLLLLAGFSWFLWTVFSLDPPVLPSVDKPSHSVAGNSFAQARFQRLPRNGMGGRMQRAGASSSTTVESPLSPGVGKAPTRAAGKAQLITADLLLEQAKAAMESAAQRGAQLADILALSPPPHLAGTASVKSPGAHSDSATTSSHDKVTGKEGEEGGGDGEEEEAKKEDNREAERDRDDKDKEGGKDAKDRVEKEDGQEVAKIVRGGLSATQPGGTLEQPTPRLGQGLGKHVAFGKLWDISQLTRQTGGGRGDSLKSVPKPFSRLGRLWSVAKVEGESGSGGPGSREDRPLPRVGPKLSRAELARVARQRIEDRRNSRSSRDEVPPITVDADVKCIAWRQTSNCTAAGVREPVNDRTCDQKIPHGASGYCDVIDRRVGKEAIVSTMHLNCSSFPANWQMKGPWRCRDAPEFLIFADDSVKYRAPDGLQLLPAPSSPSPSRGIVMGISDHTLVSAYAAVKVLRRQGCLLPVELWHLPDELNTNSAVVKLLLKEYAVLKNIELGRSKLCHPKSPKCFNVKIHSLYYSSFDQVLLLDSDNFAVRDPTYLFHTPEFASTGAVFWPDYWRPGNNVFHVEPESLLWELTGVTYVDMFEQESGQLLVDRRRHAAAMDVMMFYARPGNILYRFNLVYGDKDLFRLAWLRVGAPFHMVEHPPGWAGQKRDLGFCGMTMVQHDPAGELLFLHRNAFKVTEEANTHIRVWDMLVQFVEPDVRKYWGFIWMPGKKSKMYAVGSDACYGPANATEGFRHMNALSLSKVDRAKYAVVVQTEGHLLEFAKEAAGRMAETEGLPTPLPIEIGAHRPLA